MAEPTLYLFDGFNVLHAGGYADVRELRDALASFVALKGARGVLVLDGAGVDEMVGPLDVRYAAHADALIERLAAEHAESETVLVVSSDAALRGSTGRGVDVKSSQLFVHDLERPTGQPEPPSHLSDRLDEQTRERLERWRRGR